MGSHTRRAKRKIKKLSNKIKEHQDYEIKVANNFDTQNREVALNKILNKIMSQQRKNEIEFYKLFQGDEAFKLSVIDTMKKMIEIPSLGL